MVPDATLPLCPQSATQMLLRTQSANSACCRSHKPHEILYICLAVAHGTVLCAAYTMLSGRALIRPPIKGGNMIVVCTDHSVIGTCACHAYSAA